MMLVLVVAEWVSKPQELQDRQKGWAGGMAFLQ